MEKKIDMYQILFSDINRAKIVSRTIQDELTELKKEISNARDN